MTSRLFNILNLIYMPLFIDERAALNNVQKEKMRQTIASVPLICYIASFLTAIFLKYRGERCNDKVINSSSYIFSPSFSKVSEIDKKIIMRYHK